MLEVGTTFQGYQILEFLGAGGAGSVYRAMQQGLEREVALKTIHIGGKPGSEDRKRFLREARALARLAHPSIVRIYDFGEADPYLYYSMEYAPGLSIDKQLLAGKPYTPTEAAEIMTQVLDALDTVHNLGVLHRDIKPANVLRSPSGNVLLSDFGLAREREATRMTRDGVMLGTLPYFPPEMCRQAEVDARGDIYQAGIMLYELLCARTPYSSEQVIAMLQGAKLDPEPALAQLAFSCDDSTIACLRKAIEPDPARRFQTAREFIDALAGTMISLPMVVQTPTRVAPAKQPAITPARPAGESRLRPALPILPLMDRAPTITAPVMRTPRFSKRYALLAVSVSCWIVVLVALTRLPRRQQSASTGPPQTPRSIATSAPARPAKKLAAERKAGIKLWRARLLAERDLPLSPGGKPKLDLFPMEVAIVAAGEVEDARIIWESSARHPLLKEVNGKPATASDRVAPALLRDGENRMLFQETEERPRRRLGLLRIRRRTGATLDMPIPPAPADPDPALTARVAEIIDKAKLNFHSGKFEDAMRGCEEASRLAPRSWVAVWKKGVGLHYVSYVSGGLLAAGRGLELLSPVDADPEVTRLEMFDCFTRALSMMPVEGNIWYDLGVALRDYRRPADAERCLAAACVLDAQHVRYWWELGRTVLARVPRGQERTSPVMKLALDAARASFAGEKSAKPLWLVERGSMFKRAGLVDEARRDYQAALAAEPGNKMARQALLGLENRATGK